MNARSPQTPVCEPAESDRGLTTSRSERAEPSTGFATDAGGAVQACAHFDPQKPAQLFLELGVAGMKPLIEHILEELPERARQLESLAHAGRLQELARLAHSLQGIGRTLGLEMLAGQCHAIEESVNAGDACRAAELTQALPGLQVAVESALREWLATQSSK